MSKRVLIITMDREIEHAEQLSGIREAIIDQIHEGVVIIPPWLTMTLADIDIADMRGDSDDN